MSGPLSGIRVLDLSRVLAGPFCTMILGDLVADVIKVERPEAGDDTREWGPPFAVGESAYYLCVNRNKRSVALDLKTKACAGIARDLAAKSDVFIENFRVGVAAKMGLGYEELKEANPRIVYCSISGYGQTGPNREVPGYDFIIQAMSGLMSITGGNQYRTTLQSWKYTLPAFIFPFTFVVDPAGAGILLKGAWMAVVWTSLTAAIGIVALAGGVQGWLIRKTLLAERLLLIAAGILLVYPKPMFDAVGIGLVVVVAAMQRGILSRLRFSRPWPDAVEDFGYSRRFFGSLGSPL